MNEVKQDVIEDGLTDPDDINDAVEDAAKDINITLTDEQMAKNCISDGEYLPV